MSRPKPKIIAEHVNKLDYKAHQILESTAIYAIFYDGQPFNLKIGHKLTADNSPKYKKVSFPNPGHAVNLCKKLNALFKTNKFTVVLLNQGPVYFSEGQ